MSSRCAALRAPRAAAKGKASAGSFPLVARAFASQEIIARFYAQQPDSEPPPEAAVPIARGLHTAARSAGQGRRLPAGQAPAKRTLDAREHRGSLSWARGTAAGSNPVG